ncbi:unnamed protein product [Rotaria sp. Silwood2]|nr:unnamed protein product [Rotaria sp. Silwood2]
MVLPCTISLKKALSSFDELLKYQTSKTTDNKEQENEEDNHEEIELLVESEVESKKPKVQISILRAYEDDDVIDVSKSDDDSSGSEEFGHKVLPPDELARYLSMELDKSKLSSNPLDFWKQHRELLPVLSILARKIHCIPASSAAVEKCFSSTGFIVNERWTSLHPEQIDNIIVLRSMENLKK